MHTDQTVDSKKINILKPRKALNKAEASISITKLLEPAYIKPNSEIKKHEQIHPIGFHYTSYQL